VHGLTVHATRAGGRLIGRDNPLGDHVALVTKQSLKAFFGGFA
jgi:hypothetical protein